MQVNNNDGIFVQKREIAQKTYIKQQYTEIIDTITHMSQFQNDYDKKIQFFEDLYSQYYGSKVKYMDINFPHTIRSIIKSDNLKYLYEQTILQIIQWKSISEIFPYNNIFNVSIISGELKSGYSFDKHLLGTVMILATKEYQIKKLFHIQNVNVFGLYAVWLCDDGEWVLIILDDFFPFNIELKYPSFAHSLGSDIWIILLEKALAKLYGSYSKLAKSSTSDIIRYLTGAPVQEFRFPFKIEQTWKVLKNSFSDGYVIIAQSTKKKTQRKNMHEKINVVKNEVYSILDARSESISGGLKIFLKMRNHLFTNNTLKINNNQNFFWISLNSFCQNFDLLNICKIHQDYKYCSLKIDHLKNSQSEKYSIIKITSWKQVHGYFRLVQKSKLQVQQHIKNYIYSKIRYFLVKMQNGTQVEWINGIYSQNNSIDIETKLEPGEYYGILEAEWRYNAIQSLMLIWYGKEHLIMEVVQMGRSEFLDLQRQSLYKFVQKKYQKTLNSEKMINSQTVSGVDFGLKYFLYFNKKDEKIVEKLNVKKQQNLKPHHETIDTYERILEILPGEEYLFVYRIISKIAHKQKQTQAKGNLEDNNKMQNNANLQKKFSIEMPVDNIQKTINIIKEKGIYTQRKYNGNDINIFFYQFKFKNHVGLMYENLSDFMLKETLTLKMNNLEIVSPSPTSTNQVSVQIYPQQKFLIVMRKVNLNKNYDYNISYEIRVVQ